MNEKIKAIKSEHLSAPYEPRFVIVNVETGEILDDAQGYGYKTTQKAYAAWNYKNKNKDRKNKDIEKERQIKKWMREHKSFIQLLDQIAFEICKGSWGPDDKIDAKFVQKLLDDSGLELEGFTVGDLLRIWKR